jgi:predicted dehydrogenase
VAPELVERGDLGTVRHIEAALCFPLPRFSDIRYQYALAGGATMDVGTYTVHAARMLGREEPVVVSAVAKLRSPNVDRAMRAELSFPSGHTGRITCSMWSRSLLQTSLRVTGDRDGTTRTERFSRRPTYEYQLEAFCGAVLRGEPTLTPPEDSIANMRVLDAIYTAAGLTPRGT